MGGWGGDKGVRVILGYMIILGNMGRGWWGYWGMGVVRIIPAILGYGRVGYWGIGKVRICLACRRVFPYYPMPLLQARRAALLWLKQRCNSVDLCRLTGAQSDDDRL